MEPNPILEDAWRFGFSRWPTVCFIPSVSALRRGKELTNVHLNPFMDGVVTLSKEKGQEKHGFGYDFVDYRCISLDK